MGDKKGLDFKHKEVINIIDGKRLGFVQDVTADFETGTIKEIIVPGHTGFFTIFSTENEITIPWTSIKAIGEDLILIKSCITINSINYEETNCCIVVALHWSFNICSGVDS